MQNICLNSITSLGRYNKAKPWKTSVDASVYEAIRPTAGIDENIVSTIQSRRHKKREQASKKRQDLVRLLRLSINTRYSA